MLTQARGKLHAAKGGDRATPLELRPLASAGIDDSDEDDADWGLPPQNKRPQNRNVMARVRAVLWHVCARACALVAAAAFLLGVIVWAFSSSTKASSGNGGGDDAGAAGGGTSSGSSHVEADYAYSMSFERLRPIWHVMPKQGWQNDPNGPVFYGGYYHLFYQHNGYEESAIWGNMSWGHAISRDLAHWTRLEPLALTPDEPYDRNGVFSGSIAIRASDNTPVRLY